MKTLLAILALAACSLVAQAQTTTNIQYRFYVEPGNSGTDKAGLPLIIKPGPAGGTSPSVEFDGDNAIGFYRTEQCVQFTSPRRYNAMLIFACVIGLFGVVLLRKKSVTLCVLALSAFAITAKAQTTTNIAWRITIETVTAGVTNSVNTNFRWDASVKKDALKIDGVAYYFGQYVAGGGTDTFGQWLRTDVNDRAKSYADAKQAVDNAALAASISLILTTQSDLLSVAQKNQLIAIAALLP